MDLQVSGTSYIAIYMVYITLTFCVGNFQLCLHFFQIVVEVPQYLEKEQKQTSRHFVMTEQSLYTVTDTVI